jgi:hypothetical protein
MKEPKMRNNLTLNLPGNFAEKFSIQLSVLTFILILLLTATGLARFYVKPHQASNNALQMTAQLADVNQRRDVGGQKVKGAFNV